jgi:hypothetical protein
MISIPIKACGICVDAIFWFAFFVGILSLMYNTRTPHNGRCRSYDDSEAESAALL